MATPVFCCGFECGLNISTAHWQATGNASIVTSPVRSGSRSGRANPIAGNASFQKFSLTSSNIMVARFYVRFDTLPNVNCQLFIANLSTNCGVGFQVSDNTIRAAKGSGGAFTFGSSGVTVTTGIWYRIDLLIISSANPWTIDVMVDGVACGQLTQATGNTSYTVCTIGVTNSTGASADVFFDDVLVSQTSADYPLGAGYVNHFVPTADGTHNVAGTNDFEIGTGGVDINNASTTAWQLLDDIPMQTGAIGTTDFINLIAPANATDYVEVIYGPAPGISTPTTAPRGVEVIVGYAENTTGVNNLRIAINDNGTTDNVVNADIGTGATIGYSIKHYSDPPSAASTWTVVAGNGNFNNLRVRCYSSDPTPDVYFSGTMIEAEFAEVVTRIPRPTSIGHPFIF